jgi:hypothetical protein
MGDEQVTITRCLTIMAISAALASCSAADGGRPPVNPAVAQLLGHEAELLKLTLTSAAETRLGIQTTLVEAGTTARFILVQGEVVAPGSSSSLPISAPADPLALAALQVRADGDVAKARADVALAQKAADRAAGLVKAEAGSERALDEAQATLAVATASLQAAKAQRALLGSSAAAAVRQDALWVRAAVFATDLSRIDRSKVAQVRGLGAGDSAVTAQPVRAPASANVAAGTIDLYFAIPNRGRVFQVGQRVAVDLPVSGSASGLMVPRTAIVIDIYGGEWVYVQSAPQAYERRRIEVAAIRGTYAMLARGLKPGDKIVTAGAAELFGSEFGAK